MKQQPQEKHCQFLVNRGKGGETAEFEIFKDEHFLKHKKKESQLINGQPKVQNSQNASETTQLKCQPKQYRSLHSPKPDPHFRTQVKKIANMRFEVHCSQQLTLEKPFNFSEEKAWRQSRIQRYDRKSNSEVKVWGQIKNYQPKSNNQKIGILKRIIEHYNIKSMEKTFESNLISKNSSHSEGTGKNKLVSVKKVVPKSALMRQTTTRPEFAANKLKGYLNLQGINIIESYFNPASIQVQAKSISELIKGTRQSRAKSNKTVHLSKKQKIKKQKKAATPGHITNKGYKFQTLPAQKFKTLQGLNDNCINVKINKFKEFIFMINFANRVYRELDIPKYAHAFKIYIGRGNNCNLIKAVMKRRFWFQITKNMEEANFVWTQLKEESLYQRQDLVFQQKGQNKKQSLVKEVNEQDKANQPQESVVITRHTASEQTEQQYASLRSLAEKGLQYQVRERKDLKSRKYKQRNHPGMQPQKRILTKQQIQSQRQIMQEVTVRKRSNFNDRIRHLKGFKIVQLEQLKQQLIHNHMAVNGLLGNKKAMFYMLKQYCRLVGKDLFEVVPLTFHIKKGFLDEQFKQFMAKYMLNKSNKALNYWVIKPGEFSNRGQGITCTNKLEEIRSRVGSLRNVRNKSLILQQYITRPLLYNGRKFDIRTYLLLTVNNSKLRGYWYQDGYIRTSSFAWSLQQIGDSYIHLTNDAIQKYSSSYGKYEPGNKLTYSQLQRYLDNLPKNGERELNFQNEIYPKLKQIATDAIRSTFCFIDPSRKGNNFQIFGFDFMIDSEFKPWLIQINTNPCLEMSCPVLDRIIPSMVQNAFRIGLDPLIPPPLNYSSTYKYSIPENALHYNKFQLIFDEQRDGAVLKEMYQGNEVVRQIDQYEEDKEVYEEEGEEITLDEK